MTTRQQQRAAYTAETRLSLMESDLDEFERTLADLQGGINRIIVILIGLLISITTASIMLVLNLTTIHR